MKKHSSRTVQQKNRYPIALKNNLDASATQSGNVADKLPQLMRDACAAENKGNRRALWEVFLPFLSTAVSIFLTTSEKRT